VKQQTANSICYCSKQTPVLCLRVCNSITHTEVGCLKFSAGI
jgi:hypothetical protein